MASKASLSETERVVDGTALVDELREEDEARAVVRGVMRQLGQVTEERWVHEPFITLFQVTILNCFETTECKAGQLETACSMG